MPNFEVVSPSLLSRHRMNLAWPGQQLSWCTEHPAGLIFCECFSLCFILVFMICRCLWCSLTPALIVGSKELLLHTKASGSVCSQHRIHLNSGSSLLVNSPGIPAAGLCHQAGTPLVINPGTHQLPIPLLPNTGLAKALELSIVPFLNPGMRMPEAKPLPMGQRNGPVI